MKNKKSTKVDYYNSFLPKSHHCNSIVDAKNKLVYDLTISDIKKAVCASPSDCANAVAASRTTGNPWLFFVSTAFEAVAGKFVRYRYGSGVERVVWVNDSRGQLEPKDGCVLLPPSLARISRRKSQTEVLIDALRAAGENGVPKKVLMRVISQIGARVTEAKQRGYEILSKRTGSDPWVTFVLKSEPKRPLARKKAHPKIRHSVPQREVPQKRESFIRASA